MESHYSCAQIVLDLARGRSFKLSSLFFFTSPSFLRHFLFLSDTRRFGYMLDFSLPQL